MHLHWHRCMCTTNNNTPSKPVQHQAPGSREVEEGGVCNRGDLPLVGELISARGAPATLLAVGRHRLVLCQ